MCDTCSLIGETYRPNAEFDSTTYERSVHAFPCPLCNVGHQRPNVTAGLPFEQWRYECDHCLATGTRKQIQNSAFYAERIAPRTCKLCGGKIRPAADRMQADWWMQPSHKQIWRCEDCAFTGTFRDFTDEADRQLVIMPDYEPAGI